jgi:hypothetical protein
MPYRTKAERDRENWKTIPEVVTDIGVADDCKPSTARNQLRRALMNGDLWPLRWQVERGDRTPPIIRGISSQVPDDLPPRERVWSKAKIDWKTGRVRDDWGDYNNGKWRVLLIHRLAAGHHWPQPSPVRRSESPVQVINPSTRNVGGRPTPRDEVYTALRKMQGDGYDMSQPPKRLAEEVAKRCGKKLGAKNWAPRTITDHVSKWISENAR